MASSSELLLRGPEGSEQAAWSSSERSGGGWLEKSWVTRGGSRWIPVDPLIHPSSHTGEVWRLQMEKMERVTKCGCCGGNNTKQQDPIGPAQSSNQLRALRRCS